MGNSVYLCEDQCPGRPLSTQGCTAQLSDGNGRALRLGQDDTLTVLLQKEGQAALSPDLRLGRDAA